MDTEEAIYLPSLDVLNKEIEKRELEGSLLEYVKWSFQHKKKLPFIVNKHHVIICEALEKVFRGEIQNLIINIAPRYSKTEIGVKAFIEWSLAQYSDCSFIHLSYSDALVLDNSSEIREDIKSDWYQQHWALQTKRDADAKGKWYTTDGGGVYATGTMGSLTGFGAGKFQCSRFAGAIIIDDPIKPEEAYSETTRKKANERLENTIISRRNDTTNTPIIIIMQRLHEEDMSGFCLNGNTSLKWTHLSMPCLNEDETQSLWPAKHTVADLQNMRAKNRAVYAGQYQQTPSPDEGMIFKKQFWKYYKVLPPSFHQVIQSWDFAVKDKATSDFNVGLVGGRVGADKYLIDRDKFKGDFAAACRAVVKMSIKHPKAHKKLVEDKANGSPVLSTLKKTVPGMIPIIPVHDKVFRANAALPDVEAGNWYLPHPDICPWIEDFIDTLAKFPNDKHDDDVDAFTMMAEEFQKASVVHAPIAGHSNTIY
jgi:predicted phage terminase large subunit-like protein